MSMEDNKKIVGEFFKQGPSGNFDTLADDVTFWVAGRTPHSGMKSKKQIQELLYN